MKTLLALLTITGTFALSAFAESPAQAGPLGGRLLSLDGAKAEFFVKPDRTILVAFYDDALKPVAPAAQVVTAIAEAPSGKVKLEFQPKDEALVSTAPLPEGSGYNIVVQIRATTDARPKNFRIAFETHTCGECNRPEYACTCNH